MINEIQTLLEKTEIVYLEVNLKNGDSFNIRQPNQNIGNDVEVIDDSIIKWVQVKDNGCTYENYIRVDDISMITGIYNCPSLLEDNE